MPKATFYTHVAQPAAFACRLIARAIRDGGQILVWSDSSAAVQQLDVDLWQQIPESFIPHEVWLPTDPMPSETPVLLAFGNALPNIPQDCTVLNLSADFGAKPRPFQTVSLKLWATAWKIWPKPETVFELIVRADLRLSIFREKGRIEC